MFAVAVTVSTIAVAERSMLTRWLVLVALAAGYAVLIGLRDPLAGTDTANYVAYMEGLRDTAFTSVPARFVFAPSYFFWYLAWIAAQLNATPQAYVFLVSVVSLAILARGLWLMAAGDDRETLLMWVILFASISAYLLYGNVLRQALAVSVTAVALGHFMHGRTWKAFLIALLGILCHRSMMIIALLVPLAALRVLKTRHLKVLILLIPLVSPFIISVIASAGIPLVSERIASYQNWQSSVYTYLRLALLYMSVFFYDLVILRTSLLERRHERLYRVMLLITATTAMTINVPEVAGRLLLYMVLFHAAFLARMFIRTEWRDLWLGLSIPVLMMLVAFAAFYPGVQVNYTYGF